MTTATSSLLGLRGISREEMLGLLEHAASHLPMVLGEAPVPEPARSSRIIANVFLEDSTRTRCSFEIAAKRLGHQTVNLTSQGTSVSKGESLHDTAATVSAMGVDAIVIRCRELCISECHETGINSTTMRAAS